MQPDAEMPVIKQNFFKEIYESERGKTLKMYGAELTSSDNETIKPSTYEQDEKDEVAFIQE